MFVLLFHRAVCLPGNVLQRLLRNSRHQMLDKRWSFHCYSKLFLSGDLPEPQLNYEYLCDPTKTAEIRENILGRKGVGDIDKVVALYNDWTAQSSKNETLRKTLTDEALKIPNQSHPNVRAYGEKPAIVEFVGSKPEFDFEPKHHEELATSFDAFRTKNLGVVTGPNSYYLKGALVHLESALIKFTLNHLLKRDFQLVSVSDLLPSSIVEGCGMPVHGIKTQVYTLNPECYGDICLSGTAEMALAGMHANTVLQHLNEPVRLAAVSRCFRAEISELAVDKGLYRVHQFTKVEMFGLTAAETCESESLHEEFLTIQKELFSKLGLHFQVLDMPSCELGASAYRKYDIEAWMPGRGAYGEISSCTNCTDYQSRRLHILYENDNGSCKHVHTVNGTACAIPRMLIAILETFQQNDGSVVLPSALKPYLNNLDILKPVSKTKQYIHHFLKSTSRQQIISEEYPKVEQK